VHDRRRLRIRWEARERLGPHLFLAAFVVPGIHQV
jgi:hypothetical protein